MKVRTYLWEGTLLNVRTNEGQDLQSSLSSHLLETLSAAS